MDTPILLRELTLGGAGKTWSGAGVLRVGRRPELEVALENGSVSRSHAEIRPGERGWEVVDCGSTNGTHVNHERLTGEPRRLRLGDVIRFGGSAGVTLTVELTEDDWLRGADPFPMLAALRFRAAGRQLRLYAVAVCRHIRWREWWPAGHGERSPLPHAADPIGIDGTGYWLPDGNGLPVGEPRHGSGPYSGFLRSLVEWAEGRLSAADLSALRAELLNSYCRVRRLRAIQHNDSSHEEAYVIASDPDAYRAAYELTRQFALATRDELAADPNARPTWCDLLREGFRSPFRPAALDPGWLTSDVVDLARGITARHDFGGMPILADALMDAGCDDDDVLAHCRQAGGHHLGCWLLDAILRRDEPGAPASGGAAP